MLPNVAATDREMVNLVLREHAESLAKQLLSLQEGITEKRIHETRVQSRGLRAAIDTFQDELAPGPLRRIRKDVRYITRVIGKSRETAVTCELLKGLCADIPAADCAICEYVIRGMEEKLKRVERRMKRKLRSVNPLSLSSQIDSLLPTMAADDEQPSKSDGGHKPSQLSMFPSDRSILERARDAFIPFSRPIKGFPKSRFLMASDDELHQVRIAAKKMRYTNGVV